MQFEWQFCALVFGNVGGKKEKVSSVTVNIGIQEITSTDKKKKLTASHNYWLIRNISSDTQVTSDIDHNSKQSIAQGVPNE